MIDGKILIEKLLIYAETFLHLDKRDEIYFRNLLLKEFKLKEPYLGEIDFNEIKHLDVPDPLIEDIWAYAIENGLTDEEGKERYSTYIMGILSPRPSEVNRKFKEIKENEGIEKACEYFYDLSVKNDYVKKTAISKNLKWEYRDGDRILEITVNLSKPEKDNKDIAKLISLPKTAATYPQCLLCKENEGFEGSSSRPARENIRTVSLSMGNEPWFVQYSPYAYYNEHLIAISENHTPMHIKSDTIDKVLDFVDYFPNYMIGSNAALPIIGGSILNHEHFQGGGHIMPMHKAPVKEEFRSMKHDKVKVLKIDWYNSAIRLVSRDRKEISALAKEIVAGWEIYSNASCGICAEENGVLHNSCSPIARKTEEGYVIEFIFRNNATSEQYPDGVFHAHPEYHNIKKEGIGLIEAMGLFILPGRLKKQLDMIADILCGNQVYDENALNDKDNYLYAHRGMIKELYLSGKGRENKAAAEVAVRDMVNRVCKNILINTAVFKDDETGNKGFNDFLKTVNIVK